MRASLLVQVVVVVGHGASVWVGRWVGDCGGWVEKGTRQLGDCIGGTVGQNRWSRGRKEWTAFVKACFLK